MFFAVTDFLAAQFCGNTVIVCCFGEFKRFGCMIFFARSLHVSPNYCNQGYSVEAI
jgi:hypothetical protein